MQRSARLRHEVPRLSAAKPDEPDAVIIQFSTM